MAAPSSPEPEHRPVHLAVRAVHPLCWKWAQVEVKEVSDSLQGDRKLLDSLLTRSITTTS